MPTAAALEGDERVAWWLELGRRHYEAMGVEAVPVPVLTRADADDPGVARLVAGVGLIYFSGGDPHHLAATLRGSRVWDAVVAQWRSGAALAGCSAGAMALTAGAPPELGPGGSHRPVAEGADGDGLGLVGRLAVIPHFDVLEKIRPGIVERFGAWKPPGTTLIGIDEETALVAGGDRWQVAGNGAVWVFGTGQPARFGAGDDVALAPPGAGPD